MAAGQDFNQLWDLRTNGGGDEEGGARRRQRWWLREGGGGRAEVVGRDESGSVGVDIWKDSSGRDVEDGTVRMPGLAGGGGGAVLLGGDRLGAVVPQGEPLRRHRLGGKEARPPQPGQPPPPLRLPPRQLCLLLHRLLVRIQYFLLISLFSTSFFSFSFIPPFFFLSFSLYFGHLDWFVVLISSFRLLWIGFRNALNL